jgi:signal transduction histidine kinase
MHQMQLQFFTNISHEFRTPLSLILGPLEKLQKEEHADRFRHHYQTMHRNASRLLGLVNELMDFRKAESGVLKLKAMPGSLELFLEEIADEFTGISAFPFRCRTNFLNYGSTARCWKKFS